MVRRHKKVNWTKQGYSTLDEAIAYVAEESLTAAQQLLETALDTAESLAVFDERGRIVPELQQPNVRGTYSSTIPADLRNIR
jgi:plasmid stabilization system protein ParE